MDSCGTARVVLHKESKAYHQHLKVSPTRSDGGSVLPHCLCRPSVEQADGVGLGGRPCPPVLPGSEPSVRSAERAYCSPTLVAVCVTERFWFPIVLRLFNLLQTEMYHTLPALSMQSVDIQVCIAYISNNSNRASRMQATGVFMNTLNFSSKQTHLVLQPS